MFANQEDNVTRVRDLFPAATYFPAGSDPRFGAVWDDASLVGPGDLYVHLDEADSDDAELAVERGAAVVVAERLLPVFGTKQVVVADCHVALRKLYAAQDVTEAPPVDQIVVGGSAGDERAATLLASIRASAGSPIGLRTERCEDDGEHCVRTRGGSTAVWLRRCGLGGVRQAVVQATPATPFHGRTETICLTAFRCDGLTPQGERRWDSVASHRAALRTAAGLSGFEGTLVTNADDPDCLRLAATHPGRLFTFGESGEADLQATAIDGHSGGQTFLVACGADSACVALPTPGRAARRDALAAIATALAGGMDLHAAVAGLDLAAATPGCLESVVEGQAFGAYLDFSVRPLDLADALEGAGAVTGRVIAVVRLSEDASVAREQIATASRSADRVFAHGELDDSSQSLANVTVIDDRLAAMAVALGLAEEGDAVLVAGCTEGPRGTSDRNAVVKLLRRRLACEDTRAAA